MREKEERRDKDSGPRGGHPSPESRGLPDSLLPIVFYGIDVSSEERRWCLYTCARCDLLPHKGQVENPIQEAAKFWGIPGGGAPWDQEGAGNDCGGDGTLPDTLLA